MQVIEGSALWFWSLPITSISTMRVPAIRGTGPIMGAAPSKGGPLMSIDFTRKLTLTRDLVTLRPARGSDAAMLASL